MNETERSVSIQIGHRSGEMKVGSKTNLDIEKRIWYVESATFSRTARRLFEGNVYI
jgi:2-methylaconitate cis-trans-isomerase PrpF